MIQSRSEEKNSRWRPAPIKITQDLQERFKNLRTGKRGVEETEVAENSAMAYALFDENVYFMSERELKVCIFRRLDGEVFPNLLTFNIPLLHFIFGSVCVRRSHSFFCFWNNWSFKWSPDI